MNLQHAREFLSHFPGSHCFAVVDDKKRDNHTSHFHTGKELALDDILEKLEVANEAEKGVFFCVNPIDRRYDPDRHRTSKMLTGFRAVFADDDKSLALREDWPIEPSLVVESSPKKFHYYWLVHSDTPFTEGHFHQWEAIQLGIVRKYGTDDKARDCVRVLRLPGSMHHKGAPFEVKFYGSGVRYSWEQICAGFPVEVNEQTTESVQASVTDSAGRTEANCILAIIEGTDYHGSIMWLLNHWVNKGEKEPAALCKKIMSIMVRAKNQDERWEARTGSDYIAANVRDAIRFVEENPSNAEPAASPDEIGAKVAAPTTQELPPYPYGWMEKLPEPWPLIFKNFASMPRTLDEVLLVPTILSTCGYMLKARYLTGAGRRPNMIFLNLAPSAAYKDVNSSDVIRQIGQCFAARGAIMNRFSTMVSRESSISSDTAFLKAIEDNGNELFWINTEATRIFQQISGRQRGAPSSVLALSDKLIDVVNGHAIQGKRKAAETVKSIGNPNVQVIFYAQPGTIMEHIDASMVASGLLGRVAISHSRPAVVPREEYSLFGGVSQNDDSVDDDFYAFFNAPHWSPEEPLKRRCDFSTADKAKLNEWGREKVHKLRFGDNELVQAVVERVAITAEQLYAIVLGVCQTWDEHREIPVRQSVDAMALLPIIEYFQASKLYTLGEYVSGKNDEFADLMEECVIRLVSSRAKLRSEYVTQIREQQNMIQVSALRKEVKRVLRSRNMESIRGDVSDVFNRTLNSLVRSGVILKKEMSSPKGHVSEFIGFKLS